MSRLSVSTAAGAHPKGSAPCLTPGANTTDALWLCGAWVEYTRKT